MKASYKKKDHKFVIIMLIISVVCCILTNAAYSSGVSNIASSAVGIIVTPLQKAASGLGKSFNDLFDYFGDVKQLKEENAALKAQITELTRENSSLSPLKAENEMLYAFLGLKKERIDLKLVNAEIISRSSSNYTSDFTVDKGSVHGIEKNMAVMTEDGSLLGIIIEVGATYSRGKTITSYDYGVGVKNERTGEPGMLSGDFELSKESLCMVTDLYDSSDYAVGDVVRTSALGDTYPPDIYVGTVEKLVPDSLGYTVSAIVRPSASVLDTDTVMIITDFDRDYVEVETDMTLPPDVLDSEEPPREEPKENNGELPAVPDVLTDISVDNVGA